MAQADYRAVSLIQTFITSEATGGTKRIPKRLAVLVLLANEIRGCLAAWQAAQAMGLENTVNYLGRILL